MKLLHARGAGLHTMRRWGLVTLMAAAAATAALSLTQGPAQAATTHNWIATAGAIHSLYKAYPTDARYFYDRTGSYGQGTIQDGFATTSFTYFTSYAAFKANVGNVTTRWVAYDPEAWYKTPAVEQQYPEYYMRQFGALAHKHNLKVMMEPARDLGKTDVSCPRGTQNLDQWYVNCHIATAAVINADALVVQTQADTINLAAYDWLFNNAKAQANAQNPSAWVDAELSGNYGTPAQAFAAGSSVNADGYWFAAVQNPTAWWDSVLTQFKNAGY